MKRRKQDFSLKVTDTVLKEILATFFFTIGVFSLISLILLSSNLNLDLKGTMGNVGLYISQTLGNSFGICSFIIPVLMFYLSYITFTNNIDKKIYRKLISGMIFLISITALMGSNPLFGYSPAGGWAGNTIFQIFKTYVTGSIGTYIILTILTVASLLILTGIRIEQIIKSFYSAIDGFVTLLLEFSSSFKNEEDKGDIVELDSNQIVENEVKTQKLINLEKYEKSNKENKIENDLGKPEIIIEKFVPKEINKKELDGKNSSKFQKEFILPPINLLDPKIKSEIKIDEKAIYEKAELIENALEEFGIKGKVKEIMPGPVITMFEYKPAPGIRINKITVLEKDIASKICAVSIRIIAPIPGKDVIGFEVPNTEREIVVLREFIENPEFKNEKSILTLALGKDIAGKPYYMNLPTAPHLMIAGTTGSGKSVLLNAVLTSLLYKASPHELKFIMIDPKNIELSIYEDIPHLLHPVVTDPKKAAAALKWAVQEMESRYKLLSEEGSRDIESYNKKLENLNHEEKMERWIPYIVIVIDELGNLMMDASEIKELIIRLSQKARAAGIHIIVATQRPSVDVVSGSIKANFPARISFRLTSQIDSRTILDTGGAESLLGQGDMLFLQPGTNSLIRLQGAWISDKEREKITDHLKSQGKPEYIEEITFIDDTNDNENFDDEKDELYEKALRTIAEEGEASISMIQRRLKIGYNRSANIVDIMEKEGVIGPKKPAGQKREVYIDLNYLDDDKDDDDAQ